MANLQYGKHYLKQYGWTEGEALQRGGLAKPILVKHKFDQKGLGANPQDNVAWWERVFDGQLKAMQLGDQGFVQNETEKKSWELEDRRKNSPLYQVFVKGQGLKGSIKEQVDAAATAEGNIKKQPVDDQLMVFDSDSEDEERAKIAKKLRKKLKKKAKIAKKVKKALKAEKRAKKLISLCA